MIQLRCCALMVLATGSGIMLDGCGTGPGADPLSSDGTGDSDPSATVSSGCQVGVVTYAEVAPIFTAHCTSCHARAASGRARHNAPVGLDFDSYTAAAADAGWASSAVRSGSMPPGARLTQADRCLVEVWASEGAPQ